MNPLRQDVKCPPSGYTRCATNRSLCIRLATAVASIRGRYNRDCHVAQQVLSKATDPSGTCRNQ